MKEDIKARWVEALRSGEYMQGQGGLRTRSGKFCCLGVLCELALQAGVVQPVWYDDDDFVKYAAVNDQSDVSGGYLPSAVLDWAELENPNPLLYDGDVYRAASVWNDELGVNFNHIADMIERSL